MISHRDEILRPAVSTDATAVPRYDIVRPDGTIIEKNAALRLANPVAREGTPISKAALDEMLAASGVTAGTATAYTLAQDEYTLFDGAPVRFRLHAASEDGATLNVGGTGAKPLRDMMGEPMAGGIPAGTWLTAFYSAAAGAYILAGGEAVRALYGERDAVDDAVAYVKDVPVDALPAAEVGEVGGMTYKVNVGTEAAPVYELRSAPVTKIESVGKNRLDIFKSRSINNENITIDRDTLIIQTQNAMYGFYFVGVEFVVGKTYTFSVGTVSHHGASWGWRMTYKDGTHSALSLSEKLTMTISKDIEYVNFYIAMGDKVAPEVIVTHIQCVEGDFVDEYHPYYRYTLPIADIVQALDGYGHGVNKNGYNRIDWKKKQYIEGSVRYVFDGNEQVEIQDGWFRIRVNNLLSRLTGGKVISNYYDYTYNSTGDKVITCSDSIYIYDSDYATIEEFKKQLLVWYTEGNPLEIIYIVATPIITDISDILPADNLLPVETGGTITAINEYNYAVPTKITYQRDVLANRASIFALEKLRLAMELLAKADLSNVSGTFGGVVKANAAAVSALGTAQVRNVAISATDLTAGSSALATGDSYRVYS